MPRTKSHGRVARVTLVDRVRLRRMCSHGWHGLLSFIQPARLQRQRSRSKRTREWTIINSSDCGVLLGEIIYFLMRKMCMNKWNARALSLSLSMCVCMWVMRGWCAHVRTEWRPETKLYSSFHTRSMWILCILTPLSNYITINTVFEKNPQKTFYTLVYVRLKVTKHF